MCGAALCRPKLLERNGQHFLGKGSGKIKFSYPQPYQTVLPASKKTTLPSLHSGYNYPGFGYFLPLRLRDLCTVNSWKFKDKKMENTANQKVWFITGASKGLGLTLVKKLLEQGYQVAATSRTVKSLEEAVGEGQENFLPLAMDLVDENQVKAGVAEAVQRFGSIDVVVNNAGYGQVGAVEEVSDEFARKNFDVNVFGTLNVIRAILPVFRKHKTGHIFNLSSTAGFQGFGGAGIYSASKFAIDGLSESLAEELKPFGIRVTAVKPGYFRTNFLSSGSMVGESDPTEVYRESREARIEALREMDKKQQGDPEKAAAILIRMSQETSPPLHLFLGPDAVALGRDKLSKVAGEMDQWEELSKSTNFN
jgi:NAD(P)-dependent dehydrogenase (short-subunit alcohol dehydrogenase family)